MSRPQAELNRRAILEATRAVVEERKGKAWTLEDVADRAELTRMTVYRHFSSRTRLLIETVRYVDQNEGAEERFAVLAGCASGVEALDRWVGIWADYIPRIHRLAEALLAARHIDAAAAQAWDDRMEYLRQGCQRIVTRLHREGRLASSLTITSATDLMWTLASVQVWEALTESRGWSDRQYRRHLRRLLRRALMDEDC